MTKSADHMAGLNLLRLFVGRLREKKINFAFGLGQESTSEGLVLLLDILPAKIRDLFVHRYLRYKICGNCGAESDKIKLEMVHFEFFEDEVAGIQSAGPFADNLLDKSCKVPDYKCDKCGQTNENTIGVERLTMAPEIIVILFNKYTQSAKMQNNFIPDKFELPGRAGQPMKYKLVGQARHSGSLNGGHYWAAVRRGGGVFIANDHSICQIPNFDQTPLTYMAFFSLV
jgi:ubiquitin C-terminal hydrolase